MSDVPEPTSADQPKRDWNPEEQFASLAQERNMFDDTPESQARRILEDGVCDAAQALMHIVRFGEKEHTRLQAAKVVMDRVWGPEHIGTGSQDPLRLLVGEIVKDAEQAYVETHSQAAIEQFRPDTQE